MVANDTYLENQPTVIVLAAGKGSRFLASGAPQHKLHTVLGQLTVLEHTFNAVKSTGLPYVVVLPEHNPAGGMGDSIAAGVKLAPNANGWLVLPADLPMIQPTTLLAVAQALHESTVVKPVYQGRYGHPVGFNRSCGADLLLLRGDEGARRVVQEQGFYTLEVNDVGCVADIDTLADLERVKALSQTNL